MRYRRSLRFRGQNVSPVSISVMAIQVAPDAKRRCVPTEDHQDLRRGGSAGRDPGVDVVGAAVERTGVPARCTTRGTYALRYTHPDNRLASHASR